MPTCISLILYFDLPRNLTYVRSQLSYDANVCESFFALLATQFANTRKPLANHAANPNLRSFYAQGPRSYIQFILKLYPVLVAGLVSAAASSFSYHYLMTSSKYLGFLSAPTSIDCALSSNSGALCIKHS